MIILVTEGGVKEKETTELCGPTPDHPRPYSERESEFLQNKSRERLERVLRASSRMVPLQDISVQVTNHVFLMSISSFYIIEP